MKISADQSAVHTDLVIELSSLRGNFTALMVAFFAMHSIILIIVVIVAAAAKVRRSAVSKEHTLGLKQN